MRKLKYNNPASESDAISRCIGRRSVFSHLSYAAGAAGARRAGDMGECDRRAGARGAGNVGECARGAGARGAGDMGEMGRFRDGCMVDELSTFKGSKMQ